MTPKQVALACPFCGHDGVSVHEGSTFRWRYAACDGCGAQAGEVRAQTLGDGTKEEWEAAAHADAIAEWNRRATLPDGGEVERLRAKLAECEADARRYRWLRSQHWNESVMCVVVEPKDNVRLCTYCPSAELLDAAIDAAQEAK